MEASPRILRQRVSRQPSGGGHDSKSTFCCSPVAMGRSIRCSIPLSNCDVAGRHRVSTLDRVEGWTVKNDISRAGTHVIGRRLRAGKIHSLKHIGVFKKHTDELPSYTYEEAIKIKGTASDGGTSGDKHAFDSGYGSDSRKRASEYETEIRPKKSASDTSFNSHDQHLLQNEELMENYTQKHEPIPEILEQFEEDVVCSICAELFVKPTILICSHTFCKKCIAQWKKKSNRCPICRSKIVNTPRDKNLVKFVEKTVTTLTEKQRVKRAAIISQRHQKTQPPTTSEPRAPNQSHASSSNHQENARAEVATINDDGDKSSV